MTPKKSKKSKKMVKKPNKTNQGFSEPISSQDFSAILDKIKVQVENLRNEGVKGALISQNVKQNTRSTPFHVLIGCIISLRTKDSTTEVVSKKLFERANNVEEMANLSVEELAELLYPAGFYNNKAKQIHELCQRLVHEFDSVVPDEIDELLKFKGVGRKTANLVRTLGFNKPGICVDTHVQRISHRIGFIPPKKVDEKKGLIFHTADETEMILRKKLEKRWWIDINDTLVTWGQTICAPISPKCSECIISTECKRVGVTKSR